MSELTEREEQEMIDRAKTGDPEANYRLSLWALERAVAEPEEDRWNRLAAKCLVKAAEAGYEPAKERMEELLRRGGAASAETEPAEPEAPADSFDWAGEPDNRSAPHARQEQTPDPRTRAAAVVGIAAVKTGAAVKSAAGKLGRLFSGKQSAESAGDEAVGRGESSRTSHVAARKRLLPDFSSWDDYKWKKMQLVCIVVCVVLALLIVLMIVTGKKGGANADEQQIPAAATTVPVEVTPTPTPLPYPDDATRAEIEAADLSIYPEESEYVSEATTATVSAGAGLNLRDGPGSSYSQVVLMSYNAEVEVYAYKTTWALVLYNDDTWGWCSGDYLKQ